MQNKRYKKITYSNKGLRSYSISVRILKTEIYVPVPEAICLILLQIEFSIKHETPWNTNPLLTTWQSNVKESLPELYRVS